MHIAQSGLDETTSSACGYSMLSQCSSVVVLCSCPYPSCQQARESRNRKLQVGVDSTAAALWELSVSERRA